MDKETLAAELRIILMDPDGPASDATRLEGENIPWGFDSDLDTIYIDGTIELPQLADAILVLLESSSSSVADTTTPDSDAEPYYQAICGSWDCRAPECRPKGI